MTNVLTSYNDILKSIEWQQERELYSSYKHNVFHIKHDDFDKFINDFHDYIKEHELTFILKYSCVEDDDWKLLKEHDIIIYIKFIMNIQTYTADYAVYLVFKNVNDLIGFKLYYPHYVCC